MKKTLSLLALAGMFAFSACGPSKEELEKKEQARKDSIAKDSTDKAMAAAAMQKRMDDSIAAVNAKAKATADSIHMADSIAASKKGGGGPKKPKTPPPPPEIKHTTTPKGKG